MQAETGKENQSNTSMRIDKWLKVSRLIKTRAMAAKVCEERKVKINGEVAKPAKLIKPGDTIVIRHKSSYRTFEVLAITQRSVSAENAKKLYKEHALEISEESKELMALFNKSNKGLRAKYKGRPTKKERREITRFRGY